MDDFQANDLALCIKQSLWRDRATGEVVEGGPRAGQILRVISVGTNEVPDRTPTLRFSHWGNDQFVACNFVKLRPESECTLIEEPAWVDA